VLEKVALLRHAALDKHALPAAYSVFTQVHTHKAHTHIYAYIYYKNQYVCIYIKGAKSLFDARIQTFSGHFFAPPVL
jgi:hypothetical protein